MSFRSTFKKSGRLLFTCMWLLLLSLEPAQAQTILPDKDGVVFVRKNRTGNGSSWTQATGELADALKAAKTNAAIKQIWVAEGVYHPLYSPADNNFGNPAGADNAFLLVNGVSVYGGFRGNENSLANRPADTGQYETILDAETSTSVSYHVVVAVGSTTNTTILDGFTIRNGNANSVGNLTVGTKSIAKNDGGGITLHSNSVVVLRNLVITGNQCNSQGGGIMSTTNNEVIISNCRITGNIGGRYGGGVYHHAEGIAYRMTITNSIISGNSLSHATIQQGGGIHNGGDLSLRNVLITGNKSLIGSGIVSIGVVNAPRLTLLNCTLSGNQATGGGTSNVALFTNSVYVTKIHNTVIYGNSKGLYNNRPDKPVEYRNSLVQEITTDDGNGNINGSTRPFFINAPKFDTAPFTGGSYWVIPGSPLVNAGNAAHYTGSGANLALDKDLAGKARVYNYGTGGVVDIGAYEYHPVTPVPSASGILYVKKYSTGTGSSWANALGEVADAMKAARGNPNIQQIWVARGTYIPFYSPSDATFGTPTIGRNASFVLMPGVSVYGGFVGNETNIGQRDLSNPANQSILSADLYENDESFDDYPQSENFYHVVIRAANSPHATVLDGFTIAGGNADGEATHAGVTVFSIDVRPNVGGGIAVRSTGTAPISFSNLKMYSNFAKEGGAINVYNSNINVTNSEIHHNYSSQKGAAIFQSGSTGESHFDHLTIRDCNNTSEGGALYASGPIKLHFSNSNIYDNKATRGGGIMVVNQAELNLQHSILKSNTATNLGGAIYLYDRAKLNARNVAISGNYAYLSNPVNGAGIYASTNTQAHLVNVLINGNKGIRGSALYTTTNAVTTLTNVTLSGNNSTSSTEPGAIMTLGGSTLNVHNSIAYGNSGGVTQSGSNTILYKYSLVQGATTDDAEGNINGNTNPGFTDAPTFSTAQFTGGDYTLIHSSPVIDKGSNALYTAAGGDLGADKDLAGIDRVFEYATGGVIEMGAYEKEILIPDLNLAGIGFYPTSNITSTSQIRNLIVRVSEISGNQTNPDFPIELRISRPSGFNVSFDPSATSLSGQAVENSNWERYNVSSSNFIYLRFTGSNIPANGQSRFGISFQASSPSTPNGQKPITSSILSGSNDSNTDNNSGFVVLNVSLP